ncbi:hypothetical protein ABK040_012644 [Willaertia magna]
MNEVNNNYILNTLINNNKDNVCYNNIKNNVINLNNISKTLSIIEVNKNKKDSLNNNKEKKEFDIIKEMGDFKFECKYGNKKLYEMDVVQREILKSQFKIFAYAARNVIFNLMNINGYKYKRNVVIRYIDP